MNWGGNGKWGGNINGLPDLGPTTSSSNNGSSSLYESRYDSRYEPQYDSSSQPPHEYVHEDETQKEKPSAFDGDPTNAWSPDAVEKNKQAFKTIRFLLRFKNREYLATMLFATPKLAVHTSNVPSTIELPINSEHLESASFMFSQNTQTKAVARPTTTARNTNVKAGAVSMFSIP